MNEFFDIQEVDEKQEFINHMNELKNHSVQENVFRRKFLEIKQLASSGGGSKIVEKSNGVKNKIWTPTDIFDKNKTIKEIEELDPIVEFVKPDNEELMNDWLMLRYFCHTMEYDQNPGRFLRFVIRDRVLKDSNSPFDDGNLPGKYLGATSVVSDIISVSPREDFLGWTKEDRLDNNKLRNSAIGSCIMPTQPFGYNFMGGKLVACLTAGKVVQETWNSLYNDILVGMTTTSLYGRGSMYDGMPKYWSAIGETAGKISLKPDDEFYEKWHQVIKDKYPSEYTEKMTQKLGVSGPVTGAKQRIMNMIFSEIGIKSTDYQHGYKRGIYYCLLYENGKEFFQSKITELELKKKSQWTDDSKIIEWWREKAIKRYIKLHEENRLKPDILYYSDLLSDEIKYPNAKDKYFSDVGR